MDYLDTKKEFRHRIILFVGYILIALAITTTTLILVQLAYGFGIARDGAVIQKGLTFFSSQPNPANIYIDGKLQSKKTNTRLFLPADIYDITLAREGYRDWQRSINLEGGSVEHFDYPLLFPKSFSPKKLSQTYAAAPALNTQSPDKRWLFISQAGSLTNFDVYDLKNPADPPEVLALPASIITKPTTGTESLLLVEWSDDNRHLLIRHNYDDKHEFIMIDRVEAAQSVNLTTTLAVNPSDISLIDKKYDKYYLYDVPTLSLQTVSLKDRTPVAKLPGVLAYKSYSDNMVLYVTATGAPAGKVQLKLLDGDDTYVIRTMASGAGYLTDLTKYDGTMYVAAGSTSDTRVYIYRDPVRQLINKPKQAAVPIQVLHVNQPNYLSFSPNTQFIMAQNGTKFGVYDIENKLGYNYTSNAPLDAPQAHATWMDGDRLAYTSNSKVNVADYDNMNRQSLMPGSNKYLTAYAPDYRFMYNLVPSATAGQYDLMQTSLLIPADQ